jgi:hypothetical protein
MLSRNHRNGVAETPLSPSPEPVQQSQQRRPVTGRQCVLARLALARRAGNNDPAREAEPQGGKQRGIRLVDGGRGDRWFGARHRASPNWKDNDLSLRTRPPPTRIGSLAPPPSRAAGAPAPPRDTAPSTGRAWGRSSARHPRGGLQPLGKRRQHRLGQHAGGPAVAPPPVAPHSGAVRVVARRELLHPARGERECRGHVQHRPPLGQPPDRRRVPRLGGVLRRPVALFQLRHGQALARTGARQSASWSRSQARTVSPPPLRRADHPEFV